MCVQQYFIGFILTHCATHFFPTSKQFQIRVPVIVLWQADIHLTSHNVLVQLQIPELSSEL